MKRSYSAAALDHQSLPPFYGFRCAGSSTVYVLTGDVLPRGSLLHVMCTTDVGVKRDCGVIELTGLSDDVAAPLFGLLMDKRRLPVPAAAEDDTYGDRLRAAADYLQLPASITARLAGITTSSIPYDVTFHFPRASDDRDRPIGRPAHATWQCRVQRIRSTDASAVPSRLCHVFFFGDFRHTLDCVYRIEHQEAASSSLSPADDNGDVEGYIIDAMAKSAPAAEQPVHDTVVYLMHACNAARHRCAQQATVQGLSLLTRDHMLCMELLYDHFGRARPAIRLYGQQCVYGEEVVLPPALARM